MSIVSVNVFWFGQKLQSADFEKLIFYHVFNVRNTKRIAKFDGLEPRRCEDIKPSIVALEIGPKSFGAFEKRAQDPSPEPGARVLLNSSLLRQLKPPTVTKMCYLTRNVLIVLY